MVDSVLVVYRCVLIVFWCVLLVYWDELGFPPSPRGGSLDLGAAEGVSSWAAAGHMRAAGLRL